MMAQIRGYGLGKEAEDPAHRAGALQSAGVLDAPFRPRTACHLEVKEITMLKPAADFELPPLDALTNALPGLIARAPAISPSPPRPR